MQQTDRIELMKVAAMLTIACCQQEKYDGKQHTADMFNEFYRFLELSLEMTQQTETD
jgi:hypothetical protein